MLTDMPTATLDLDDIRALTPAIRALAPDIERAREVPDHLIAQLSELGVFRLAVPRSAGGLEADPATMLAAFEELGRADGSVGWCAMIGAATGVTVGRLDDATAARLLAEPRFMIAGVAAPTGRATVVPGGYRVTGRWSFASGSRQASHLVGGCVVVDGDGPVAGPGGVPQVRHVIFPADAVTVHDTWSVSGLCGTGSHDIEATDVPVAGTDTFSLFEPARQAGPLYAFPVLGLLAFGIGAVALGIARAAGEEFARLAAQKRSPMTGEPLAAKPSAQAAAARAESLRAAGLAYLAAEMDGCWRLVSAGEGVPPERRASLRLAVAHAAGNAAQAVDLLYHAAGGTSVYAASPLQRCFRDVHVATQHAMVNDDVRESVGAVLLGQQSATARL